ncbi:MAG: hypothetical protein LBP22_07665 [Deltaproteobacteria bacterium]|jgi:hypothetical protein|nr:hypothetical protein [Deltaproteobacteria bacterium]
MGDQIAETPHLFQKLGDFSAFSDHTWIIGQPVSLNRQKADKFSLLNRS